MKFQKWGGYLDTVVDVGCGLGEIIGNIPFKHRYGYDINDKNIKAAKKLHKDVVFRIGSFKDIQEMNIDFLISVGFAFSINPEKYKKLLDSIKGKVSIFVIDTYLYNDDTEYIYSHNGNYLFSGEYRLIRRSNPFYRAGKAGKARRYIEFWGRK